MYQRGSGSEKEEVMQLENYKISLAAARVNAEMTQEDVAKEMHVSKNTVLNWEKGKVIPNFATLNTLSAYRDWKSGRGPSPSGHQPDSGCRSDHAQSMGKGRRPHRSVV